ncbi:hypothetical protein ABT246_17685 [Streptomyces sp. NPDC001553]|uniref:hypothetical protein n=1 Tax=Streptomyces sp. NPDC001553 TaxID=3154385 RepID=UPI0033211178
MERLLVIRTMADLALRLPTTHAAATGASDGASCRSGTGDRTCTVVLPTPADQGVPPQIAAAFEDLARDNLVHAPTTSLPHTLHEVLNSRASERTELLAEQLRSPDPATRHDAIRMTRNLIASWRGDHTRHLLLLADCLLPHDPYTAAAAAEALGSMAAVAEPAREPLASYVTANRTTHGHDAWASPHPLLRRAHQEAVLALATLGDERSLPDLLTALDADTDAWRVVNVADRLPTAAPQLVPRLIRRLASAEVSANRPDFSVNGLASALAALGDTSAAPVLTDTLRAAVRHKQWRTAAHVLGALASFGPLAATALATIRPLADAEDVDLRAAATVALWDLERSPADSVPRLRLLLDTHRDLDAVEVLGRIGPPTAAALPHLRKMLDDQDPWTRVHSATALWKMGGAAHAGVVVHTLLRAWQDNDATSTQVLTCLNSMGEAARPALPRLREALARTRCGGPSWGGIGPDEEQQSACRALLTRLQSPPDQTPPDQTPPER